MDLHSVTVERKTKETDISVSLSIVRWVGGVMALEPSQSRTVQINTGVPFFDHMLHAMAFHGGLDLEVRARGDIEVDAHHTVEDVGIVLGRALAQYQAQYGPVARFAHAVVPMDDALGQEIGRAHV